MKLLRGLDRVSDFEKGSVATIGNFDGVHLGHQSLLAELRKQADQRQLPLVVLLFEPQPGEYFHGQEAPARLASLREKLAVLKHCKVDYAICLRFDESLALMSAEDFVRYYFIRLLRVQYLLVGEDFRFGARRLGDLALLKSMGAQAGCQVESFADFNLEANRVSSTRIRQALAQGNLSAASHLLGRTFSLCGRVKRGDGRGREWGIPTANLSMHRLSLPLKGVFCVQVRRANGLFLNGVANLGCRPTVDGSKNVLEIHLLDFDENLYGERLEVFFLHKLREEVKFSSVDALIAQIHSDVAAARLQFSAPCFELNALTE